MTEQTDGLNVTEAAARRWVSVKEFADYLGISTDAVHKLARTDPGVRRVTRRLGGRVLVCLWAWQQGEERRMAGSESFPDPFPELGRISPRNGVR